MRTVTQRRRCEVGAALRPAVRRRGVLVLGQQRGAVAVEAALILPIFLVILFSIFDFSMVLRDSNAAANAVRSAGRAASAVPREVMTVPEPRFNTVVADNVNNAVIVGVKAAIANLNGMPNNSIRDIWFYQAASDGTPTGATSVATGTCTTNCVRYQWDGTLVWTDTSVTPNVAVTGGFRRLSGSWPASAINACQGNTSSIGVYLRVQRNLLFPWTRWIARSNTVDLSDSVVFRFEPKPTSTGIACQGNL